MSEPLYRHICEVCDFTEDLTSEDGFNAGWDYPPRMGVFGVLSPRTCPNCIINKTVWWTLAMDGGVPTEKQLLVIERIQNEPESILVKQ